MDIDEAIGYLEKNVANPEIGLPEEIFLFISRITPMVNIDLLIKDENGRTLLSWRDDKYSKAGWHLPGGILRYKEKLESRIQKVAEIEIGTMLEFEPVPIAFNQFIIPELSTRGHFISFLYKCFFSNKYELKNIGLSDKEHGYLKWHNTCPENIIKVHEIYRKYIDSI